MWLFLRRRLILWVALAIGVPFLDWLLGKLSEAIRARKGDSAMTRGLDSTRSGVRMLRRKRR
jgi:hypothetical protein